MKKKFTAALKYGVLGISALGMSSAQAVLIDEFTAVQLVQIGSFNPLDPAEPAPTTKTDTVTDAGSIIGAGTRKVTLNCEVGPGSAGNQLVVSANGGVLNVSNGPTSESTVILEWDAQGADLTDGGLSDAFKVNFAPAAKALELKYIVNGTSEATQSIGVGATGSIVDFNSFSDPSVMTSANSIVLQLTDGAGWTAAFNFLQTGKASEPGTLFLMMSGTLLGFAGVRRKIKR